MLLGGAAGSAPLIVYEWISGGGTFKSLAAFAEARPPGEAVRARLAMLGEVLISDGQYRAIWNGPASLPGWVMWAAGAVACAALFSAAARTGDRKVRDWHRVVALWFGLLAAAMIFSSLRIAQHHLATLIPLAAASAGIAASRWAGGKLRWVLAAAGAVYLAAACYWNVAAIEGIRRTGGAGAWSDAIYYVGAFLQTHGRGREVVVLDWGLNNNLYVASGGRVRSVELFWGATREHSSFGRPWRERAGPGTLALVGAGANRVFTAPGEGFLAAAYASGLPVRRVRFFQRSGEPYAEAIEIGAPGQTGGERFEMRDPAGRLRAAAEW
jgi:hypothetical protein